MIGHASIYKNKYEMVMVAKRFGTYVFLGNLGLSSMKIHLLIEEVVFFLEEIFLLMKIVFGRISFAPWETSFVPPRISCYSMGNLHCPLRQFAWD
jgi:hypothetical protein